jgi:hypothetical protein
MVTYALLLLVAIVAGAVNAMADGGGLLNPVQMIFSFATHRVFREGENQAVGITKKSTGNRAAPRHL